MSTLGVTPTFSTSRILFAALVFGASCAAAQADPVRLHLRPGLWEMTSSGQMHGAPPIPPEMLAAMPPDRRAKIEAAIAKSQARASAPHVIKQCITAESLQHGINVAQETREHHCKPEVISSTSTVMDMKVQCSSERQSVTGQFHFEAPTPEAMTGKIHMTIGVGGHAMSADRTITGKWLGADCGDVKPFSATSKLPPKMN